MKFTAAKMLTLKSDEELLVLCHGDQRVLVPLPDTYEGAERLVKEEFGLDGPIEFETNELAECDGVRVRIRWDTWKTASLLSAQMFVKETPTQRKVGLDAKGSEIGITAVNSTKDVRSQIRPRQLESVHDCDQTPTQVKYDKTNARPAPAQRPTSFRPLTPASSTSSVNTDGPQPSLTQRPSKRAGQKPIEVKSEPLEFDEDDESDVPMQSAVEWSDEECDIDIKKEAEGDKKWLGSKPSSPKDTAEERSQINMAESSTSGRRSVEFSKAAVTTPPPSQERRSSAGKDRFVKANPRKTKPKKVGRTVHRESTVPDQDQDDVSQISCASSTSAAEDQIGIEVKYGDSEPGFFTTRPGHTVDRVLAKVCKHMNIEHLLSSACLVILVEGDDFAFDFQCEGKQTMADIGAKTGSKFRIAFDREAMEA